MTDIRAIPFLCVLWWIGPYYCPIPDSVDLSKKRDFTNYSISFIHSVITVLWILLMPTNMYPFIILVSQSYFIVDGLTVKNNRFLYIIHHIVSGLGIQGIISYPYISERILPVYFWGEVTNIISNADSLLQFCNRNDCKLVNIVSYMFIRNVMGAYHLVYMAIHGDWCGGEYSLPFMILFFHYSILYFGSLYWSIKSIRNYRSIKDE